MALQYIYPSNRGLFRLVQHGHRWRALLDGEEIGRYECMASALSELRLAWPKARLPLALAAWRCLEEASALHHARVSRATCSFQHGGLTSSPSRIQRSRRLSGRSNPTVTERG